MFRIIIIALFFAFHPVHVTLLSIEYSAEEKLFNGFLKVYYDDFLLDCRSIFGKTPEIQVSSNPEEAKKIIGSYLSEKLHFFAGENELKPEIVNLSLAENELKMNLKFEMKRKSKVFRITNNILSDIYRDQSNLLIFRYGKYEEGVKLTPEMREQIFRIK